MYQFKRLDDLTAFLRKDQEVVSLCPIRLISVDTMEMWVEVKKILLSMSVSHIYLSKYCKSDDTTPNIRRLIADLRVTKGSACVLPLSEYLRIRPNIAKSTIEDLIAREYPENGSGKLRIYIPIYRMRNVLKSIRIVDPRKKNAVVILETGEETDYSLTIIQKDLNVRIQGNEITGFKQYLQYWEQNPDKPLILHTKNAIDFEDNVFFDNVRVIVTSYDLIKFHYQLPNNLSAGDGKPEDWDQLARDISENQTFEGACCNVLLIHRYTRDLMKNWPQYSPYQKWLFWLWSRVKASDQYLSACVNDSTNVESFEALLYCKIEDYLSSPMFDDIYSERKELLRMRNGLVPADYTELVSSLSPLDALRVLTDLTDTERKMMLSILKAIPDSQRQTAVRILRTSYSSLASYIEPEGLNGIADLPKEFKEYFAEYRWYKAADTLPEVFVNRVQMIAKQGGEGVYAMKSRNLIVNEEYDDETAIIFVDGMGLEYASYLLGVLGMLDHSQYLVQIRAGFCNLPTTTAVNKDFLDGRKVAEDIIDLDQMKHGSVKYPGSIMQELAFLDTLRERVVNAFTEGIGRVILTSDHGSSRMAVLVRKTPYDSSLSPEGHQIYKYGRFCEGTDLASKCPTAIEHNDKLIFADYTRFDQRGAPADEIHGGAALEEWLVPIILIDKVGVRKEPVVITGPKGELRPDLRSKKVKVQFKISGYQAGGVAVRIKGQRIECLESDGSYEFEYKPGANDITIKTTVYGNKKVLGEFTFTVKKAIQTRSGFDI